MTRETNPYAAPAPHDAGESGGSTLLTQIFVGFSVGAGFSYAATTPVGLAYLWILTAQGAPVEQLYVRAYASSGFLLLAHGVGFAATTAGGFWATRIGKDGALTAAVLAGLVFCAFVFMQYMTPYPIPQPGWSRIISVLAPLPAFILGALWARRMKASK